MTKIKLINVSITIIMIFLSINAYSQYGVIEMKNGELYEMATPDLIREKNNQLRYFPEDWERKTSVMGIGAKKLMKEYKEKSKLINISDIKQVHAQGELTLNSKSFTKFIGIRYIKIKKKYKKYYVLEDGYCSLLVYIDEGGNIAYSYYLQKGNEEPYELHRVGTVGPKYKKRSKKYFADCKPALGYIKKSLNKTKQLPKLVKIYNDKCSN